MNKKSSPSMGFPESSITPGATGRVPQNTHPAPRPSLPNAPVVLPSAPPAMPMGGPSGAPSPTVTPPKVASYTLKKSSVGLAGGGLGALAGLGLGLTQKVHGQSMIPLALAQMRAGGVSSLLDPNTATRAAIMKTLGSTVGGSFAGVLAATGGKHLYDRLGASISKNQQSGPPIVDNSGSEDFTG